MSLNSVRVRFAPSPTGYLHIGGLRTALYNYLFAKNNNGKFILRIEDTDQSRFVSGAMENLVSTLRWAGMDFDEGPDVSGNFGPYIQSQRTEIYRKHVELLLESGHAYRCFCTPERLREMKEQRIAENLPPMYDRKCRELSSDEIKKLIDEGTPYVVRLSVPLEGEVIVEDLIRGESCFQCSMIDDQVLLKSDGFPTYHLANVIDDHFMEISHVIRGEEWLPSTPKHILLYRAFEWKIPLFAHLPLLLNPDRSKLSKRQGDVAVEDYMNKGYLRESLINYVALLGWHPSEDREIFSIKEMEKEFDLQRVNKSGAVFDIEKLNWMNSVYIKEISLDVLFPLVKNYLSQCDYYSEDDDKLKRIIDSIRHTLVLVSDIKINGEIFYRFPDSIDPDALEVIKEEGTIEFLRYVSSRLNETSISSIDEAKGFVKKMGADTKRKGKQLFVPLRVAFTASLSGPGVNEMLFVLGEKQSKIRVDEVINRLGESL